MVFRQHCIFQVARYHNSHSVFLSWVKDIEDVITDGELRCLGQHFLGNWLFGRQHAVTQVGHQVFQVRIPQLFSSGGLLDVGWAVSSSEMVSPPRMALTWASPSAMPSSGAGR